MKPIQQFLTESYSQFEADIEEVNGIIDTFSNIEKQMMGPRKFYDKSELRKILYKDNKPVAFFEARLHNRQAKINYGCDPDYRRKELMDELWEECIQELKKRGTNIILAAVSKRNVPSQKFLIRKGMKQVTDPIQLGTYLMMDRSKNLFELKL